MLHNELQLGTRMGQVYLRVTDLERSTAFYRDVLGFSVTVDGRALGLPVVLLTGSESQHHVALTAFGGTAAAPRPRGRPEMAHFAILYRDPLALAEAVLRLLDREYPVSHAADHGGTVSIYLDDPDGNGIELYHDRPHAEWPVASGPSAVTSEPFEPTRVMEVLARRPAA